MSAYTFDTNLLSAASVGSPQPTNTALSASGVNTISLSSIHIGIAFNAIADGELTGSLVNSTFVGSVFKIDRAYDGAEFALILPERGYTTLTYTSASPTFTIGDVDEAFTKEVSVPDQRRLWTLGYL